MDNVKGIIIWAVFLAVIAAFLIIGRRIRRQIDENGIEVRGTVSRVEESYDSDTGGVSYSVYARYRTEEGDEIEGLLLNAPSDLQPGERVRLKYHPKLRTNAKLLNVVRE